MSESDIQAETTRQSDGDHSDKGDRSHSRRRFLQTAAATGVATVFSGIGTAQFEDEQIELGGLSDWWVGQAPEEIERVQNPTHNLEEGESYEVTWQNLDGVEHNFVIINEEGEHLLETDLMGEAGETQSVEFEAESEMAEYYCGPHPQTMCVEITIDDPVEQPEEVEDPEPYFPEGPTVSVNPTAEGLVAPTDFGDLSGSDLQFVAEQTGEIYAISEDGREEESWLDISDRMVAVAEDFYDDDYADPDQNYDERGLVGLEFHPDYDENGRFVRLCSFGTRRSISRVSDAPVEVVNGGFEQHFTDLQPPASRTHGGAERALD